MATYFVNTSYKDYLITIARTVNTSPYNLNSPVNNKVRPTVGQILPEI